MLVKTKRNTSEELDPRQKKRVRAYQPGAPRYACDFELCKSTFSRLEHLKRHKLIHEAVLPFKCNYCHRPFSRKDILTRHIKRQHSDITDDPKLGIKAQTKFVDEPEKKSRDGNTLACSQSSGTSSNIRENLRLPSSTSMAAENFQLLSDINGQHENAIGFSTTGLRPALAEPLLNYNDSVKSPFGDNTQSPTAILGNSSQSLSYLLNEDFVNWILTHSDNKLSPVVADISPNVEFQTTINPNYDLQLPPFYFPEKEELQHLQQINEYDCNSHTCERIRAMISLPNDQGLVNRYISPAYITYAVDIYWKLHNRWPILHKPSFRINNCPAPLLISMISFAMYLTNDPDAMTLAIKLHDTLRFTVYMMPEFKAPTAIWVFQTLLLAEIFEMMTSTEEQHDMSIRFHNVLIASMRKGGTMGDEWLEKTTVVEDMESSGPDELEEKEWRHFIKHEMKKRIAFFAFVLDTQHSAFFNHPPSVFISDLPFDLPCEEDLWEADSLTWLKIKDNFTIPPSFTHTISSFLKLHTYTNQLSPWNMMIILHGLISVAWNLRLRETNIATETTIARISSNSQTVTRDDYNSKKRGIDIISESYYNWLKNYRITFIINGKLPYNHPYIMGCLTTYEFAHIILNASSQDMQYAMAVLADPLTYTSKPHRFLTRKTQYALNQWVNSRSSIVALSHALDLLEMFLMCEQPYEVQKETAFHRPWGLYMATVTIWIYQFWVGFRRKPASHVPLPLVVYLGNLRAIISEQRIEGVTEPIAPILLDSVEKKAVIGCQANVLLQQVLELLAPCRWGVLQTKLKIMAKLLGEY